MADPDASRERQVVRQILRAVDHLRVMRGRPAFETLQASETPMHLSSAEELPPMQGAHSSAEELLPTQGAHPPLEHTYRAVFEALDGAPVGVAILDRELRCRFVNRFLANVGGRSPAAHLGRTLRELFPESAERLAYLEDRIRAVLDTGEPSTFTIGVPTGGAWHEWLATYVPVVGPSGEVDAACGLVMDITLDREREAGQARARAEAERTARRLDVLQQMTLALSMAADPSAVSHVVAEHARRLLEAASVRIRVVRGTRLDLLASSGELDDGSGARSVALEAGLPVSAAAAGREPVWLEDHAALAARFPMAADAHPGGGAIAALPLATSGRLIGVLSFAFDEPRPFDLEERALVLSMAARCAQALDRALLLAEERELRAKAQRATDRLERLQAFTAALSRASTLAEVADVLVQSAGAMIGAQSVIAFLRDRDDPFLRLGAAAGRVGAFRHLLQQVPLSCDTPAVIAARSGEACWLESGGEIASAFPAFGEIFPFLQPVGALAALPLRSHGTVLGSLGFVFDDARRFPADDRELLTAIARQCAEALDRARLLQTERDAYADAQHLAERLARLQEITAALSASRTADEIARTITERVHAVVGAAVSFACVLDATGAHRLRLLGTRLGDGSVAACAELPLDEALPGCRAAAVGEPLWLQTAEEVHAAFPGGVDGDRRCGSLVALPLRAAGTVIGSLGFAFDEPRSFSEPERSFFLAVGEQCAVALDRARLVEDERSARSQAERARAEAESARAESERVRSLLDGLVDNAPLGIAVLDRDLRFQRINATLAEANGLPAEAHIGRTPRELLPGLPMDDIERTLRHVIDTGESLLDFEITGETPAGAGKRIWLETWYPVRAAGHTVGVGAIVREVTRERRAEEFQRHVMGIVGHDLRNPLSAVLTATRLLLRSPLEPAQERLVGRIGAGVARIEEIVRTLLDFARVRGGGGVPLSRRRCDLAEVYRNVVEECRLAHPGRQIRCEGQVGCTGDWDPDRIAQLLTNLISNALDHSEADEPVRVRCSGGERDIVVEVANAGPPIPAEIIPRLFEPFLRGEGGRSGGLGLGLFIAQAIAVAHGGRIDVRSGAPVGTVFSVRLPR